MLRSRSSLVLASLLALNSTSLAQNADDASYRAATGLLHRDMPREAAAEYRAFLKDHPTHEKAESARYALAVCLVRLGLWDEAATELDPLSGRKFEFAADVLLLRAQCHVMAKDNPGAIRCLETLLKDHADFAQADAAAAMLGEALIREGETEKARAVLNRFERQWPKSESRPRAEVILAILDASQGRDREAADRLARLRKDFPASDVDRQAMLAEAQSRHRLGLGAPPDPRETDRAVTLYRSLHESKDKHFVPAAALGLAQLARAAGDAAKAGQLLDDLLTRFPSDSLADNARIERARAHLDEDQAERALAALDPILKKPDAPADAAYWAAKAELRMKRFGAAADRLDRAAKQHADSPLLPEILFDRAVALARDDKPEEAAALYAGVRARFPKHALAPEALAAQASLALAAKDSGAASALSREFIDAYPKHARASSVQLVLAEALALAGKHDEAAKLYAAFASANAQDPRSVEAAIRRGLSLAQSGKTEEASKGLDAALAAPGQVDDSLRRAAQTVLADAAIARSDWPAAEKWLRALTSKDASPDALLKLGIALQRQGHSADSVNAFNGVINDAPSDPAATQARFERAQVFVEQGELDKARSDFEAVLKSEESAEPRRFSVHSLRHLASIASRQNRADDAAKLLARVADSPEAGAAAADAAYERGATLLAAGQYEEAETALAKFLSTSPSHPRASDAAAQRAISQSRSGHYEQALPSLEAAESKSSSMRPEILAALRYERAWALKTLGKPDEAREAYERVLASPLPASLEAHAALDLAQLLISSNQHAAASPVLARCIKAAMALSPEDLSRLTPSALYLRAACELKLDKAPAAAATLDDLLSRFPKSDIVPNAQLLSGQALLKSNKPEAAAERLESAIAAKLKDDSLAPALLCLGEAHAAAQRWDKSRDAFEQHLRHFPKSEHWFQSQFGVAWALEHEGRHAEAISTYREVVAKHEGPTAARAQFQIGECLFAQKQYDDAVRELLKVDILYAYPEWSAAALYEAGRCLAQLNKNAEARTQFTQVTERFKDTQWARLAAEQLQKTAAATPSTLPGRDTESR